METNKELEVVWKKRIRLHLEGDKLISEGDKLHSEGDKLWEEAIISVYGNIQMEWRGNNCYLPNGEIYGGI